MRGEEVWAVTRSAKRAEQLADDGIRPVVANVVSDSQLSLPQGVQTILFAVGYDREAGQSLNTVYVQGLANALRHVPHSVRRLIYISSTGVYGQTRGAEVDEDSACEPLREGGQACLAAEQVLHASWLTDKSIVLRLAGLYGPGRIPRARELVSGQTIDAPQNGWLNLIHVDDAAEIVLAAEERARPPRTYVVSDGHPVIRGDYYTELARLLGAPTPRFVEAPSSAPASLRAQSDKRVNPKRLFAELAPVLKYPSYREGLTAIVLTETRAS
jgi:nucleoside-diphosphate-sugar epimerase